MAALNRVRVALTGLRGLPGVSTFYCIDANALVDPLRQLYLDLKGYQPSGLKCQVEASGDIIESTTGVISGAWATTAVLPSTGDHIGIYAAPTGWVADWTTATIADGKRIRGRTYMVPASSNVFSLDGSIDDTILAEFRFDCDKFQKATVGNLAVWHRPRLARVADATHKALAAHAGSHALVTGSTVPDKAAVMRSRRD